MSSSDPVLTSKGFKPMLRVGGVQMTSGGAVADCLERAGEGIERAAAQGATLVVLPENFATLGTGASAAVAAAEADAAQPPIATWASQQARTHGIFLVAGTVPVQDATSGKSFARSRVFGPDGRLLCQYDKIHLFDAEVGDAQGRYAESDHYVAGEAVTTFEVPGLDGQPVSVGMSVCYDLRFPELFLALRRAGAELILVPSAFTHRTGQAHWSLLMRARAVEQGCYVFGVNQCGWHDSKRRTWGHSALIDPWGDTMAILAGEPDVVVGDLSRERLQKIRMQLPIHNHHRL